MKRKPCPCGCHGRPQHYDIAIDVIVVVALLTGGAILMYAGALIWQGEGAGIFTACVGWVLIWATSQLNGRAL